MSKEMQLILARMALIAVGWWPAFIFAAFDSDLGTAITSSLATMWTLYLVFIL
jgi:hypothetical protein